MASTKNVTTKKPTGLTITRSGEWFTIKWKIGDANYGDGQQLQYHLSTQKKGKWTSISVGNNTTSRSHKIENANYYPNNSKQLVSITFRIRGNRQEYSKGSGSSQVNYKCSWSDWAEKKIVLNAPPKVSVTKELDSELTNVCKFNWSVDVNKESKRPYTSIVWQSRLAPKESNTTDGSKLTWNSSQIGWVTGTSTQTSGTVTRTEDTATLANGSYTRWIRFRARGIAGASDWTYAKHVYSVPYRPTITSVSVKDNTVGGFACKVVWKVDSPASHPIDKTTVQYTIVEPDENLACPSGATWSDANISKDTSNSDAAFFSIDDTLSKDQCLYVRVNTQHDSHVTYGTPTLGKVGYLKDPTGLSVEVDNTTHRATVTATNASTVSDAFLAVMYKPASNPNGAFVVGIIQTGEQSVTVQCPDWSQESAVSFGVYAAVGSYVKQDREDDVDAYNVSARMKSQSTIWDGGAVPVAPSNVSVAQTAIKGTVQIMWDWTWAEANSAEISWADHEDAWESTDEPETYKISNLHAARWNISGLETGVTWYMRVRLVHETADSTTNSPWSDLVSIDLSSAPTTPTLYLSSSVIPHNGNVTASWAYSTTDGTAQAYAEICEATVTGDGITYGDVIAHTTTAQQVVINAEEVGWQSGETHNLCIRVTSASGHVSDTWSDPIAVSVAEPLECEITQTSLVFDTVEENPQTFTGEVITEEFEFAPEVASLLVDINPVQSGSGTPSPSNVRPITGWDDVSVYVTGVNVWDEEWEVGTINASTGADESSSTRIRSKTMIPIKPNTNYCFRYSDDGSGKNTFRVCYYDSNEQYISGSAYFPNGSATFTSPYVFTTPDNAYYMRFSLPTPYGTTYNNDVSINYPSTDTAYHACNGNNTTTTTTLPSTTYGGTIDLVSGVLTVDRAMVDMSALGFTYNSGWNCWTGSISGSKAPTDNNTPINATSDRLTAVKASGYTSSHESGTMARNVSGNWFIDNGSTTNLAGQLVYELATPTTAQLTGQQIELLKGMNNVWSQDTITMHTADVIREGYYLAAMPLTVTVTGAGNGGVTSLAIERADDYHMDRPDERHVDGYEKETVFIYSQTGEEEISATIDSLIGALDDGAPYRLVATIQDGLGQSATSAIDFDVRWSHQAIIPEATVVTDEENLVSKITPVAPTGALAGDVCDIYRLSVDRPEIIVKDGVFGETYVDPYPAIGEFGGHRIVFRTSNGDYITEDSQPAWIDTGEFEGDRLDLDYSVIDFDGNQILLNYNVDLSSQWDKDFTETKYLGGGVQGDWNPAISRSGSVSATAITITDQETIRKMRRLANYAGVCHVRTKDGSSYAADIQVSEDRVHDDYDKLVTFSMTVTRVDPEGYEGLPIELWQGGQ